MSKEVYNVLVIGKTGSGKSSFINYLFGNNVAETGTGEPVTKKGFHQYKFKLDDLPVTLWDSWGLEADKYEEWLKGLNDELKMHGTDKPASQWFHSIFYCIQAGGHRIEDADIAIIKTLHNTNYSVSVVLTKCDMIDEEGEIKMIKTLHEHFEEINVTPLSSGGENRYGKVAPFGRENVKKVAKYNFYSSMANRLPAYCRNILRSDIKNWEQSINKIIEETGRLDEKEQAEKIERRSEFFLEHIKINLKKEVDSTLNAYKDIISGFYFNPTDRKIKISFEKVEDLKWWDYPLLPVAAIPIIFYIFISGKNINKKALQEKFSEQKNNADIYFSKYIDDLECELKKAQKIEYALLFPKKLLVEPASPNTNPLSNPIECSPSLGGTTC